MFKRFVSNSGGVFLIYYNITRGRGGALGTPNLYYVIYGRPLMKDEGFQTREGESAIKMLLGSMRVKLNNEFLKKN